MLPTSAFCSGLCNRHMASSCCKASCWQNAAHLTCSSRESDVTLCPSAVHILHVAGSEYIKCAVFLAGGTKQ